MFDNNWTSKKVYRKTTFSIFDLAKVPMVQNPYPISLGLFVLQRTFSQTAVIQLCD